MSAQPETPPSASPAPADSGASPGSAIRIAHRWLKEQRMEVHGHSSQWSGETLDHYHRDLGLLVDFVTDCWPNDQALPQPPGGNGGAERKA